LGRAQNHWQPQESTAFPSKRRTTVFGDPEVDWDDFEHSLSEQRSTRVGFSFSGRILFVVYTIRKNDKETIRIISARQATRKERQAYAG